MNRFTIECAAIAVAVVTISAFATVVTSWVAMAVVSLLTIVGMIWFLTFIEGEQR
jgi:hypothetical protein